MGASRKRTGHARVSVFTKCVFLVCQFSWFIKTWPGLLEAWLVLTSVKYHGNLYNLIPLNQRLALTRLRATGPCSLHLKPKSGPGVVGAPKKPTLRLWSFHFTQEIKSKNYLKHHEIRVFWKYNAGITIRGTQRPFLVKYLFVEEKIACNFL